MQDKGELPRSEAKQQPLRRSIRKRVLMNLQTSCRHVNEVLVVDCKGRIIFGDETAFLRNQVRDLLDGNHKIVLNLAEVSYIDSTGIGTLVGLYTSAKSVGGEVKLAAVAGRVK